MSNAKFSAFVINLDSRSDRLADFRRRTKRFSTPIERVPAVTTEQLRDLGVIAEPRPEHACHESHLAAYRLILERELDWALVMEDDVLPVFGFERRVRWALKAAPPEAWLIQLGHLGSAGSGTRRIARSIGGHAFQSINTQRREQFWWGSHAYLASNQFARFMLEQPSIVDVSAEGHDEYIRDLCLESELKQHCFVHHPNLAGQSFSSSDIGPHSNKIPGTAHASREWRRLLP